MILKFMRTLFIILCVITGGILGGMYATQIQDGIISLAKIGVPAGTNTPPVDGENGAEGATTGQPVSEADRTTGATENSGADTAKGDAKKGQQKSDSLVKVETGRPATIPVVMGCAVAGMLLGLLFGTETLRLLGIASRRLEEMEPEETLATVGGLILGILITAMFIPVLSQAGRAWPFLMLLAAIAFVYLGITVSNRVVTALPIAGGKGPVRRKAIKILDTNVIIDGRIELIMKTGFLEGQIYIPRFVLEELQLIADSSDQLRRARGRRGLDILNSIQKEYQLEVGNRDREAADNGDGVDARLVRLAKAIGGDIVTNDFNLNKVAELQGIKVLNVNDLALALKPNVLPGEEMTVMIIREGKEQNQGVAYLDDGTMVVVEGGRKFVNEMVDVVVTSVLQTPAGKMIFADLHETNDRNEVENSIDQSVRAFTRGRTRRPIR